MPTQTIADTGKPVGQGNSNWRNDMQSGKVAFPRKSVAKTDVPPAGSPAVSAAPVTPAEGTTAQPAASSQPVETKPQPVITPEVTIQPTLETAVPAATVPAQTQTPVAAAAQPSVIEVADPNAVIRITNPDGTITEKTAATIKWEEGMRAKVSQKDSKLNLKEQELQIRERDLALREQALAQAPPAQVQPVSTVVTDARPTLPEGKMDGDPEYEAAKAAIIGWEVRQGLKPVVDALAQAGKSQEDQIRRQREANEIYSHNYSLIETLPNYLPFDLDALAASDPAAYKEVLGRLKDAGASEGIDLSPEGIKTIGDRLSPDKIRIIALSAVSDGWNPSLRKAPVVAPAPIPVDPVAAGIAAKIASGEGLVPPGDPTQPLIPVASASSPAGSNPNRTGQGNSSASEPAWRSRLGKQIA